MNNYLKLASFNTEHFPREYVNGFVRYHHTFSNEERLEAAIKAGWNVFQFPSEMLTGGDLLSDSGTTTLTTEQLSALILGDEAYGSNWGYFQIIEAFENTFGIDSKDWEIYLFHQGRAAEHALFSNIAGEDLTVIANSFFDTTRANAEANGMRAIDIVEKNKENSNGLFKGNIDIDKLKELLSELGDRVPLVYSTITNNTGGGQPVSMNNIKDASDVCRRTGIPFFLDACRFAENAWFIKNREEGYKDKAIADIVKEEFALCEGFTISLKKDGLANMGGVLAIRKDSNLCKRNPDIFQKIRDHQILVEGHPTYGGMTGRNIMTIVSGLSQVIKEEYLKSRIGQVSEFGEYLASLGIPVIEPFGGHAVYIDIDKFFEGTNMKRDDFGGISLTALLLLRGIRLCELGAFAFGKYNSSTDEELFSGPNLVRAAVPRNKYEIQDLKYVADCVKGLYDKRDELPKAVPVYGRDKTLRHFKARFELSDIK